jgi:hypothetical protein
MGVKKMEFVISSFANLNIRKKPPGVPIADQRGVQRSNSFDEGSYPRPASWKSHRLEKLDAVHLGRLRQHVALSIPVEDERVGEVVIFFECDLRRRNLTLCIYANVGDHAFLLPSSILFHEYERFPLRVYRERIGKITVTRCRQRAESGGPTRRGSKMKRDKPLRLRSEVSQSIAQQSARSTQSEPEGVLDVGYTPSRSLREGRARGALRSLFRNHVVRLGQESKLSHDTLRCLPKHVVARALDRHARRSTLKVL